MDPDGNIFGLSSGFIEPAIVFELERTSGGWSSVVLFKFKEVATYPLGAPVLDKAGNIYGTTVDGGSPEARDDLQTETFKSRTVEDGDALCFQGGRGWKVALTPELPLTEPAIFTARRSAAQRIREPIFELTAGTRLDKVLWTFDGKDGREPLAPVVLDSAGNLFGTTSSGGGDRRCYAKAGCGNAFELTR